MKRICLIIDGGYLAAVQNRLGYMDILKLKNLVEETYGPISRGYYITSVNHESQQGFYTWIRSSRGPKLELIQKSQKSKICDGCGKTTYVEKGVDVEIATTVIRNAHKDLYDVLVLINGDGDLVGALKYVRDDFGKDIVLLTDPDSTSVDLQEICSIHDSLVDVMPKIRREINQQNQ